MIELLKDRDASQKVALSRERVATAQLLFSTFLFGISFIGQKLAMDEGIGPLTYTACRFTVSTILLVLFRPVVYYFFHSQVANETGSSTMPDLFKWGCMCGTASFGGSNLQQIGLLTVSAGKAAFITGMYVIFVPIVELLLPGFGQNLNWRIWVSATVSLSGMYFLSGASNETNFWGSSADIFESGEMIIFVSMLFWVVAIISADIGTKRGVDGVSFTMVEFMTSTILSIILALIFEFKSFQYPYSSIKNSWKMIVLVGFTEGMSFLFATLGQMYTEPSKAALIFSLESVTAAIGAYICLGESLSYRELFGCFLMLSAAVLCTYESSGGIIPNNNNDEIIIELQDNIDNNNDNKNCGSNHCNKNNNHNDNDKSMINNKNHEYDALLKSTHIQNNNKNSNLLFKSGYNALNTYENHDRGSI